MSEENNKKTNFFKEVIKSIKDLDKYEDFALETPGKAFKYFIKLMAICFIIISIFYTYNIVENMNSVYANLKNKLPDFSYTQGTLTMKSEEPVVIEDYKNIFGKIIIDTNITGNEIEKYESEKEGILILKDKCIFLENNAMGQVAYKYEDIAKNYNISDFTKQDVVNSLEGLSVFLCPIIFVYVCISSLVVVFLDALLISVLVCGISRILKMKLKFAPSFGITVHAYTLPLILNLIYMIVNLLTGFEIKYFGFMYYTILFIYVIVAILMIKTDFINRQMELMKIAEEQEKVKEEMRKKEEEEKQKKKEENKKPEEDNKEEPETKSKNNKKKKQRDDEKGLGADAPAFQETEK